MEEEKKIPMWKLKVKIKAKEAKEKLSEAAHKAVDFVKEHPETAVAAAGLIGTGLRTTTKMLSEKREKERYERSFYDKRTGRREWARKKPTRTQLTIINERHLAGESYRTILDDMGLLA